LSVAVLLFKVSIHWHFPISALIGIPLCVKWKMKGMAIALCTLLLLSGIGYQSLELEERYWHVGLSLAMAFSFIVMALSLEEVQGLVSKLHLESQSRLDNFVLLDEKLKTTELEWVEEKERTKNEVASLAMDVSRALEDKQTYHKLAQLAKEELVQVRDQHEQLIQDLFYKKQQISQLHERIEESELSLQELVNSDHEKRLVGLTDQIVSLDRDKEVLKAKITILQSENQHLQHKLSFLEEERETEREAKGSIQQQCERLRHFDSQQRELLQQAQKNNHELKIQLMEEEQLREIFQLKEKKIEDELARLEQDAKIREDKSKVQFQAHIEELQKQAALKLREAEETCADLNKKSHAEKKRLELELSFQKMESQKVLSAFQEAEVCKAELESSLRSIQEQLQETEQKLGRECRQKDPTTRNTRQIQGMFLQLKEQFKEKCRVLDATRRELFKAQETLLGLQKESEEQHVFGFSSGERNLQKAYLRLVREYERSLERNQLEMDELSVLIASLFSELTEQQHQP
jgi:hypothetical protein